MARRGRPRNVMGKRYPSGDLVKPKVEENVWPTPEVMARRRVLLGNPSAVGELECPIVQLGGKLDADQAHAARKARGIYERFAAAKSLPRIVSGQLQDYVQGSGGGGSLPVDLVEDYCAAYEELRRAVLREVRWRFRLSPDRMGSASRQAWRAVRSLVQGDVPGNLDALRFGLDAVIAFYDLGDTAKKSPTERRRAA